MNTDQDQQKDSATTNEQRRRVMRGLTAAPVVLTLTSGVARAQSSSCLDRATQPVIGTGEESIPSNASNDMLFSEQRTHNNVDYFVHQSNLAVYQLDINNNYVPAYIDANGNIFTSSANGQAAFESCFTSII